jgi:DNA invertase Pin-like site-specific DNA recombinase
MRAAIYCRLSKNRKGKRSNVKEQERDCRDFIDDQGWQLVDVYPDDGISASDKSEKPRDEFIRMMADLRDGHIDVIVASEITRLYRRPRELEELLDSVDKFRYNVELHTVDDDKRWNIHTPSGRDELRGAAKQAAWFSDDIAAKVRKKARHRASDGRWHGGHPGYGFDYTPVVKDSEGDELEPEQLSVNEEQAKVIRQVVWQVLAKKRIGTICTALNDANIKTRDGKRWRQGNLHPILVKPAIAGLVKHPEKPDLVRSVWGTFVECSQHPGAEDCFGAIISEHDWRKLQALLSKPDRSRDLIGARSALLTGYIYCGNPDCGKKLVATRDQRGKRVYACKKDSHREGCGKIKRLADPIDKLITDLVIATLEDSDFTIPIASDDDDFTALYAEKKSIEDQQAQLAIDHYRLKVIGRVPYLAANDALEQDLAAIQRKLDRATIHRNVKELPVGEVAQSEWDAHADDIAWQREVISVVLQGRKIIVKPSQTRHVRYNPTYGARFDPETIDFDPPVVPVDHGAVVQ